MSALEGGGLRWGWSRGSIHRARFSLNVIVEFNQFYQEAKKIAQQINGLMTYLRSSN